MSGWPTDDAVKRGAKRLRAIEGTPNRDRTYAATVREVLDAVGLPELVSHAEVRAILSTRNPRLPAGTPAPLYENVGDRKLWLRDDIEAFAEEFQARPHVRSRRSS